MEKLEKMKEFKDLGLSDKIIKVLSKKGYDEPTSIQKLAIPVLLNEEIDLIGQAKTGTGKTAAFSLPIIDKFEANGNLQALIITPTRELCLQVSEEINSLTHGKKIKIIPVYGGQSITMQKKMLKEGVDILVGTPGRLLDLMNRKFIKLDKLKFFILDEADEMLNMGFIEDIENILKETNKDKRMLFFSATMPEEIMKIAKSYMKKYEIIKVASKELTTELTDQIYFEVFEKDKFEALCRIIDLKTDFYGIVFCKTKNDVNEIAGRLNDRKYDAEALHGDIGQNYRESILKRFKSKKLNILVATDVAARGIDINDLTHVINYSIPQEAESYVHRIGRTGRAGKEGTAITFITPQEYRKLMYIQKITKTSIRKANVPDIKDIIQVKKIRIFDDIEKIIKNEEVNDNFKKIAKDLLKNNDAIDVVGAMLKYYCEDELSENNYTEITATNMDTSGKTRLFIAMGRKDKMSPKKLVNFIVKNCNIKENKIKNVEVYDNFSFINVPFLEAESILEIFSKKERGKKPLVEKAKKRK